MGLSPRDTTKALVCRSLAELPSSAFRVDANTLALHRLVCQGAESLKPTDAHSCFTPPMPTWRGCSQRARPPAPVELAPLGWPAGQRQHAASRTTARAREEASQGVKRGAQGTPQPRGLLDCCSSGVGRPRCLHLVRCGAARRAFATRGVSELSGCSALRRAPHALRHALPVCARRGFLAAERKTKQRSQARGLPAHAIHVPRL